MTVSLLLTAKMCKLYRIFGCFVVMNLNRG